MLEGPGGEKILVVTLEVLSGAVVLSGLAHPYLGAWFVLLCVSSHLPFPTIATSEDKSHSQESFAYLDS